MQFFTYCWPSYLETYYLQPITVIDYQAYGQIDMVILRWKSNPGERGLRCVSEVPMTKGNGANITVWDMVYLMIVKDESSSWKGGA